MSLQTARDELRVLSLYTDLEDLFAKAKAGRNYTIRALPHEEVCNLLVERLAPVLVECAELIDFLSGRALLNCERHDIDATCTAMPTDDLEAALSGRSFL